MLLFLTGWVPEFISVLKYSQESVFFAPLHDLL